MNDKKIILFHYQKGWGKYNVVKEEVEFDIDSTEKEIDDCFNDWVWNIIGDRFSWYKKE